MGTLAAWVFFTLRPPMRVLVGMRALDNLWVPAHYQACAFPAFFCFTSALALDRLKSRSHGTRLPRVTLIGVTSLLAAVRLGGALPLSGHALFLSAALLYSLIAPRLPDATQGSGALTGTLAAAGL